MSKTVYIDPQDFVDEIKSYQEQLKSSPETARLSERWGVLAMRLCDNMLSSRSFCGYPKHQREDMRAYALQRLVRASQLVNLEKCPKMVFSYLCRTVHTSFVNIIMREYAMTEKRNKWIHDELARQGVSEAKIEQLLGRKGGKHYSEGRHRDAWYNHYKTADKRKAGQEAD